MTFAEKVKKSRLEAGFTQKQLADEIKVSARAVRSYESGALNPRQGTIFLIAKALKVSIKYLTDEDCDYPREDIEKDEYIVDAREQYGTRGVRDMETLLNESAALFAGGELSQEEKDLYYQAITKAYLKSREAAKEKFGKKNNI